MPVHAEHSFSNHALLDRLDAVWTSILRSQLIPSLGELISTCHSISLQSFELALDLVMAVLQPELSMTTGSTPRLANLVNCRCPLRTIRKSSLFGTSRVTQLIDRRGIRICQKGPKSGDDMRGLVPKLNQKAWVIDRDDTRGSKD